MWWNRNKQAKLPIHKDGLLYYVELYCMDVPYGYILDSGSTINRICKSFVEKYNLPTHKIKRHLQIADGSITVCDVDVLELELYHPLGTGCLMEFEVCEDRQIPSSIASTVGLLGIPFLQACTIDFSEEYVACPRAKPMR